MRAGHYRFACGGRQKSDTTGVFGWRLHCGKTEGTHARQKGHSAQTPIANVSASAILGLGEKCFVLRVLTQRLSSNLKVGFSATNGSVCLTTTVLEPSARGVESSALKTKFAVPPASFSREVEAYGPSSRESLTATAILAAVSIIIYLEWFLCLC